MYVCSKAWKMDSGGLEKGSIVRWDKNQQDWIRWKSVYLEGEGNTIFWQDYHTNSQAWRRK